MSQNIMCFNHGNNFRFSLLKTVPNDVLEKGKAIADAYRTSDETTAVETSDKELKQLESIL